MTIRRDLPPAPDSPIAGARILPQAACQTRAPASPCRSGSGSAKRADRRRQFMYKRIILAVDLAEPARDAQGSDAGAGTGQGEGRRTQAGQRPAARCRRRSWNMCRPTSTRSRKKRATEALDDDGRRDRPAGGQGFSAARAGGIYHELLQEATDWKADLIVVGSHRPVM